jgi:hypothetical protein
MSEASTTEQLIKAAQAHAKHLRDNAAVFGDDYGAEATKEEAERWERLATAAVAELSRAAADHFPFLTSS